ncbi:hypothetical protein SDC9_136515 [bioreactor metagenome]|uniref:Uncharacterized protein n=1 Tax=bioreactor metagenome TaxID=1076179 RepID=A0A645DJC1_9ZZZZ
MLRMFILPIALTIFPANVLFKSAATGKHNASSFTTCFVVSNFFNSERNNIFLKEGDVLFNNVSVLLCFFVRISDTIFFPLIENS